MSGKQNKPRIRYTSIDLKDPRTGGKHYHLVAGELRKETEGWIKIGRVFVEEALGMADFAKMLNEDLEPGRTVLTYGIPSVPVPEKGLRLVTKDAYDGGQDEITRSEEHFVWSKGAGIFAMDYDPREGHPALSRDELWEQVTTIVPGLADHDVVWMPSSSSQIFEQKSGKQLFDLKGQRLYLGVMIASDIPRAAEVLLKRFWLANLGYIFISQSGAQLVRSVTDPCMYQPSRLDYAAGAVCDRRLEQRRDPACMISKGSALVDSQAVFPDLSALEEAEFARLVAKAMDASRDAALDQRGIWADARLQEEAREELGERATEDAVEARVCSLMASGRREKLLRLVDDERPVLSASHILHMDDGLMVPVEKVLAEPRAFEGRTCSDPIEPSYGRGKAKIFAANRRLVSQAHGIQRTYILGNAEEVQKLRADLARALARRLKDQE